MESDPIFAISGGALSLVGAAGLPHPEKIAAHALIGCIGAGVNGDCGRSALAGGFAAAAGSVLAEAKLDNMLTRALVGGAAAQMSGGKFANGAFTAAFNYLLNDSKHSEQEQVSDVAKFLGQQTGDAGAERLRYATEVSSLAPDDSGGRSLAKEASRSRTPTLYEKLIEVFRPDTGPRLGSEGNANRSNAKVDSLSGTMRIAGRSLLGLGLVLDIAEVATSPQPMRTLMEVSAGSLGAIGGGIGGTTVGGLACGLCAIPGAIGGAVAGGAGGRQAGGRFYDWIHN